MSDLISVVIPVYNTAARLADCLDSVLAQTYTRLEILLVDDGSTDYSHAICESYATRDKRIVFITHEKNKGASAARNTGLDHARGAYIAFVDSDDYILPNMYEKLLHNMQAMDSDMVICDMQSDKAGTEEIDLPSKISIIKGSSPFCPVNKLYRAEIFQAGEKVRFPLGVIWEDTAAIALAIGRAKRISYLREVLYKYIVREGSQSRSRDRTLQNVQKILQDYVVNMQVIEAHKNLFTPREMRALHFRFIIHFRDMEFRFLRNVRDFPFVTKNYLYITRLIIPYALDAPITFAKAMIVFWGRAFLMVHLPRYIKSKK